ncbi:ABC transporter permease [Halobaculum sp. MBLA0147]|uniref:ABC transporter permease n=1 Tax=Halobaculum sp. MBLA0147 TaxID=3079934 RepID=UPI0035231B7B
MADDPASLLTNTQRERVPEDFESVDGAKRRRGRQRVRQRLSAGVRDFDHLVAYPDDELAAAFEDTDEETVERSLAAMLVVHERLREIHGVERAAVIERARERVDEVDTEREERTLESIDLRTREEVESAAAAELAAAGDPSAWKRRSELALKIGTALALPGVLLVPVPFGTVPPGVDGAIAFVSLVFGGSALAIGLGILAARSVKYDLVPKLREFVDGPAATLRSVWERL